MSFNKNFNKTPIGNIPNDWDLSTVGEKLVLLTDYHANGSYKKLKENVELLDKEDYAIMIRTTNFEQKDFSTNLKYISESAYNFLTKSKVYKDDIVMNKIANAGSVYRMPEINKPVSLAMNLFLLRFDETINQNYAYYFLKYKEPYMKLNATGTAAKTITKEAVKKFPLFIPPIEEQEKIVSVLDAISCKIGINNKINKTLEEMAQTLFKRWFVDFEFPNEDGEPYKSSGGEMVESELGMIPKGWELGKFRDLTTGVLGGDWGKEQATGNYSKNVYCVRGADIPEVKRGNKGKLPSRFILEKNYNNKKLNHGDLVVEISGGSPTQSTGRITYINEDLLNKFELDLVCTNFCRAITLVSPTYMEFFYYYWCYLYAGDIFFQYENGTTGIKNLDVNSFLDKYQIIKPSENMLKLYHDKISTMLKFIQENGDQNAKLEVVRDTLLPKLMSGEIRVSDLEEMER